MRARALLAAFAAAAAVGGPVLAIAPAHAATLPRAGGPLAIARDSAPVVLTGAQIPQWAEPAATGLAAPQPSGANTSDNPLGDNVRSAHNGVLVVPPVNPAVTQVNPDAVAAYSWVNGAWKEIPVQVDQRFPYFLANGHSNFGFYSGTDEELTYAWNPDRHDTGEEAWKKVFGGISGADDPNPCEARYQQAGDNMADATKTPTGANYPAVSQPKAPGITPDDYTKAMADPQPLFDTDDELAFMARDAGGQAPVGQATPPETSNGQVVTITDPLDPSTVRFVYLFTKYDAQGNPIGSSFNASNGYVRMVRDANADRWQDRDTYADSDPMKIGSSNGGYGPNIPGTVCDTAAEKLAAYHITSTTAPRASTDRTPHDSMTVTTPTYQLHADGRWLVRSLRVTKPGTTYDYGPNVIARWKGRAFQQSPDSTISVVGFEDEQVNWENNSALLGWRNGPVRAIREVWGADSGTNVTKTEYYYRDADVFNYHTRVHPIPPDGLYTDWAYRPGIATRYYNLNAQNGDVIDGLSDTNVGEVDSVPVTGQPAYTNVCDPTSQLCSAVNAPEEVAGPGFGLVYEFEMTSATNLAGNVAVVPYYRDDACFDDGTGDAPVPRPWPKNSSTDPKVEGGYVAYWQKWAADNAALVASKGWTPPASYADLKCQPAKAKDPQGNPHDPTDPSVAAQSWFTTPPWQVMPFQGAIAEHGLHFFITQDSDNTFSPKNTDEVDGQQWRFEVPMATPQNVLIPYGANVSNKLVADVVPLAGSSPGPAVPEVPLPVLLPAVGLAGLGLVAWRRRRAGAR